MKLSPSKLEALSKCPCFAYREFGDQGSEAAQQGTKLHKAMETKDWSELTDDERDLAERVQEYMDILTCSLPVGAKVLEEHRVTMQALDGLSGTLDFAAIFEPKAEVVDYKFGYKGASDARYNVQMWCYVVGIFEEFPGVQEVRGHIIAPRVQEAGEPWIFTRTDILDLIVKIREIMNQADDPFKLPRPGNMELCKLCAHIQRCPKMTEVVVRVAETRVGNQIGDLIAALQTPEPTPEQRAIRQDFAKAFEAWSEQEASRNLDFVKNGGIIPGYRLVSRGGRRKVTDPLTAMFCMQEVLTTKQFVSCTTLSLDKLGKAVQEATKMKPAKAKETVESMLAPILDRGPDIQFLQRERQKGGQDGLTLEAQSIEIKET